MWTAELRGQVLAAERQFYRWCMRIQAPPNVWGPAGGNNTSGLDHLAISHGQRFSQLHRHGTENQVDTLRHEPSLGMGRPGHETDT